MAPLTSDAPKAEAKTAPLLVVVGAGPKAAALAAKAQVLRNLGRPGGIRLCVIERQEVVAANWIGQFGFTDGKGPLGTPSEKDVGFPYNSIYGSEVDLDMLRYSWQAHKLAFGKSSYGDWIDRGRQPPKHEEWAQYLNNILTSLAPPEQLLKGTTVESIEPEDGKLNVTVRRRRKQRTIVADGVVLTGPGDPIMLPDAPSGLSHRIFNGKDYWQGIPHFRSMDSGQKVALIGGGETAASIALSLLNLARGDRGPVLNIEIINRHGTIYTRGESFWENKLFTDPGEWEKLDEFTRQEFIQRTDRGVFSVAAQKILNQAEKARIISGEVQGLEDTGSKIVVRLRRGDPPTDVKYKYDKVIVALGFNPWTPLKLIPSHLRPDVDDKHVCRELQRHVDRHLRISFDSVPTVAAAQPNVHMPMVAGLSQGPGFPNLSCLGHMADRILSLYMPAPGRSK